jgi:hypothetical protein
MFLLRRSLQQKQLTPQAMIIMREADTAPTISSSFRLIWQFLPANQALQLHDTCTQQGESNLAINECICITLIKKKTKFSSYTYKEIQMGLGAKSHMRKAFLIYGNAQIFPYI